MDALGEGPESHEAAWADDWRLVPEHYLLYHSSDLIAEANCLKLLLETWADSFSALLDNPSIQMTRREECGTKVLLIQQSVAYIKASTCLYAEESIFDQFDHEFHQILSQAEFLLASDQHPDPSRVPLSLDMAIIEAL